jgi:hypothetical protein
VLQEKAQNFS